MGCELSKLAGGGGGSKSNDIGPSEPPPPAAPDPRLPLTARQKYTMIASWKGISRAMQPTGVCMFVRLFEEHADLLGLFYKFRELRTKEQQITSEELAEHATKVMETLDEGIRGLDNLDSFFEFLYQVGSTHTRIPGFKPEYFWKIEKPFLTAVEQTLGDRYTENVEGVYKLTIKFIIETLVRGYTECANKSANSNSTDPSKGASSDTTATTSTGAQSNTKTTKNNNNDAVKS